jgi:hypothetical protein
MAGSPWACQIFSSCPGRSQRGGIVPILWRGSSRSLRTAACRRTARAFWLPSFSVSLRSSRQRGTDRRGGRMRFPASNRTLTLAALSERLRRHSLPRGTRRRRLECSNNHQKRRTQRKRYRFQRVKSVTMLAVMGNLISCRLIGMEMLRLNRA